MRLSFLIAISLLDKIFPWLPPPKKQESSPALSSSFQNVKVLTWNILAPCYTESLYQHRSRRRRRPYQQPHNNGSRRGDDDDDDLCVLDWSYREPCILQVLRDSRADIIFLQEVQLSHWQGEDEGSSADSSSPSISAASSSISLADSFRSMGYSTAYVQKMKREHPVGNVILLSNNFLSSSTSQPGWDVKLVESRSRVLIVQLQRKEDSVKATRGNNPQHQQHQSLFLLNVHLQASRDDEMTRFCQVRSLLKRLNVHSATAKSDTRTGGSNNCSSASICANSANTVTNQNSSNNNNDLVIMMGDFNMLKSGPVYHLLSTGKLPEDSELAHVTPRAPVTFLPLRDLYAAASTNHHHHCLVNNSSTSSVKSTTGQSDDDATSSSSSLPPWTYAGWSILDYIFVSQNDKDMQLVEPLWGTRISPTLCNEEPIYDNVRSNKNSNSNNNRQEYRPPWLVSRDFPHANLPSDHRPIGALLRIRHDWS
jgi:endonuclease/exonuclease/phosphatase family metal-dependent hydrolase